MSQKRYLVLENGKIFEGEAFGASGDAVGEVVFTTAMTGYLETLTDPSYYGQLVVQTFPLIGNYGIIPSDFENHSPKLKAYIVREWCQEPSNFRCEGNLDTFLKQNSIPGLFGIDTRALTKIIRETGVMNGKITSDISDIDSILKELKGFLVKDAVKSVSCGEVKQRQQSKGKYKVVLWDFGAKENIRRELEKRDCNVIRVPYDATAKEILALNPDGIMLSNGPGDPAENTEVIAELAELVKSKIPTFGICLGHQLLALSQGAKTEKLKYGHRGANQPVREHETGRVYITSQNHGYAVVSKELPDYAKESFANANDGTCEGVIYQNMPAYSVQFHPEAAAGPLDTSFLFDQLIALMEGEK